MDLASITYGSRAVGTLDDGEIERIVYSAQVNNALDGVSGFLMFNGDRFLQVLEGVEAAIEDVMSRIREDPRHTDIVLVDKRPIAERAFPDWTMGFLRLDGDTSHAEAIERALKREAPAPVREALLKMAQTMRSDA